MKKLTQEYLKSILDYNPETGGFVWKVSPAQCVKAGQVAGSIRRRGYVSIQISGKTYLAHRLVWLYVHGDFPEDQIDHINRIKDDNRLVNLRACTRSENLANQGKNANNSSGHKGVCWHRAEKKWRATIGFEGRLVQLGQFSNKEDAARAYNEKASELFGDFACLNEISISSLDLRTSHK